MPALLGGPDACEHPGASRSLSSGRRHEQVVRPGRLSACTISLMSYDALVPLEPGTRVDRFRLIEQLGCVNRSDTNALAEKPQGQRESSPCEFAHGSPLPASGTAASRVLLDEGPGSTAEALIAALGSCRGEVTCRETSGDGTARLGWRPRSRSDAASRTWRGDIACPVISWEELRLVSELLPVQVGDM